MSDRWQVTLVAGQIAPEGERVRLMAPQDQLDSIARRLELDALYALEVDVFAQPAGEGGLDLSGKLSARARRTCVVTLEPFDADLSDTFQHRFRHDADDQPGGSPDIDRDGGEVDDWPEPFGSGEFDLAELAIQQLSLALDPHPRGPNAGADTQEALNAPAAQSDGPFANLAHLLKRDK